MTLGETARPNPTSAEALPDSRDQFDIEALGATLRLELDEGLPESVRAAVREIWRDTAAPVGAVPDRHLQLPADMFREPEHGYAALSSYVTLEALGHVRGSLLLLHACGLADDTGSVAALVGPSGRGKTTAARVLKESFGYVTDETVAVDTDLTVHPYRKPLSIITRVGGAKAQVRADATRSAPLSLGAILLLDRRDDAPAFAESTDVPLIDAIAEMVPQISYLSDMEDPLQTLASIVTATGGVTRITYRDAQQLEPLVRRALAATAFADPWSAAMSPRENGSSPGFRRAAVTDAIRSLDRTCVLHDDTVYVLDGLAPTIWTAIDGGATLATIVSTVVTEHGAPPDGDPADLVTAAITELIDIGLVVGPAS